MRAYIDSGLCSGCGPCIDTCFKAFDLNDDGMVSLKLDEVPEEFFDTCRDVVDSCPSETIIIEV